MKMKMTTGAKVAIGVGVLVAAYFVYQKFIAPAPPAQNAIAPGTPGYSPVNTSLAQSYQPVNTGLPMQITAPQVQQQQTFLQSLLTKLPMFQ
jgi:hypothetical protein